MLTLRGLLCLLLLAPSCAARVLPDEDTAPAALDSVSVWTPECVAVLGPPGFHVLIPEPCLQFWIDKGDPPPDGWVGVPGGWFRAPVQEP
jgi:hypothetical protein